MIEIIRQARRPSPFAPPPAPRPCSRSGPPGRTFIFPGGNLSLTAEGARGMRAEAPIKVFIHAFRGP